MLNNKSSNQQPFPFTFFILLFIGLSLPAAKAILSNEEQYGSGASAAAAGSLVKRDQRRALVVTEYGEISSIDISDGHRGPYHIQFITLEPNSLFLPVLLHADIVFYVHTGALIILFICLLCDFGIFCNLCFCWFRQWAVELG